MSYWLKNTRKQKLFLDSKIIRNSNICNFCKFVQKRQTKTDDRSRNNFENDLYFYHSVSRYMFRCPTCSYLPSYTSCMCRYISPITWSTYRNIARSTYVNWVVAWTNNNVAAVVACYSLSMRVKVTTGILRAFEIPSATHIHCERFTIPSLFPLPSGVIPGVIVRFATLIASYSPPTGLDINFNHPVRNAYVPRIGINVLFLNAIILPLFPSTLRVYISSGIYRVIQSLWPCNYIIICVRCSDKDKFRRNFKREQVKLYFLL